MGLGIMGMLAALFVVGPVLLVSIASLIGGAASQLNSTTSDIGSGPHIRIKKTVTPYQDWNTGSQNDRTEYALFFKGSKVSADDLKKWINLKNAGLAESPTIYDAVELQADDLLVMLAKGSQGSSYLMVRIHSDPTTSAMRADVITLGGEESQYNWFPDSRLPGWSRAVNVNGAQFMIRHAPFQVVPLGHGALAKVELPYAFLASDEQDDPHIQFRAVNLNDGKMSSSLTLGRDCFAMPRFSFDHPKLDALDTTENDEEVKYRYGPKWWDKNIEWKAQPPALQLRTEHILAAPAATYFSVQHEKYAKSEEVRTRAHTNEPMASSSPLFNEAEIDQVPVLTKNCAQNNPNGVKKAQTMTAESKQIDVAVFCLQDSPVDPALRAKACGTPTRKQVFAGAAVTVNEVTFLYQPTNQKTAPIQIVVPEIESEGEKFISVGGSEKTESEILKEAFVLNNSQVLFKARGNGPWQVYLMSAKEKDFSVDNVGWFAFPSGPFVGMGKDAFLYDRKSDVLIRKKPFGYADRVTGLADIQDQTAVAAHVNKDQIYVRVLRFAADPQMKEQAVSTLEASVACFGKDDVIENEMTMAERQQWFNKYFVWSSDKSTVSLKTPCRR